MKPNKFFILIILVTVVASVFFVFRDRLADLVVRRGGHYDWAMWLNHNDAELFMVLGNHYFNGGEYDLPKAEFAYKKALTIDSKIRLGHFQLARVYFAAGHFNDALNEINKELELYPGDLRPLYVRGLILGYAGYLENAANDFRRFTVWLPKEWAGYNDLAWVLSKAGKFQEAKEAIFTAFREVLNGAQNPWLWNALGAAQINLKEHKDALASFGKALVLADKLGLGDWQRAYPGNDAAGAADGLEAFKKAIKTNLERAQKAAADVDKLRQ